MANNRRDFFRKALSGAGALAATKTPQSAAGAVSPRGRMSAQEIAKLRGQLAALARDARETAHQLGNVGQADLPDVLQAEVEADQAGLDYTTAQTNYIQAFESLAATVGKPSLPVCPLKGDLTALPQIDPQIIESLVRDSPSVKRAQHGVAEAEAKLRSAKHEAVPDLHLRAGVQQSGELLNPGATQPTSVGVISFASVSTFNG